MSADIKVPTLGESVASATIARWIKKVGEAVAADEPIVELETDKVTVEVNAPEAGVISEIAAEEGAEVVPGDLLGRVDANGAAAPKKEPAEVSAPKTGVNAQQEAPGPVARPGVGALPAAAKMMAEKNVNPADVSGTAKDGRISKGDVLAFVNKPAAAQGAPAAKAPRTADVREERVKMTRLRKTIANRLKEAQNTAAMLTTFNEVDMSAVMGLRASYRDTFEKKHKGIRLGFNGFFVKAVCAALAEFPAVNAEIDGDEIVYKNFVNMGIAVGGANGLVVPVIRDAETKSIAEIEAEISGFAKRAKEGTLKLEELSGGSFSITNGGVYGSLMSTPIINPPQSGILGMHKIQERPVVVDGKIEIRPMMYLALSYDHRIVDGREAVSFLVRVKESIEDPRRLLLAI
ncbi:2-oxoglutarate dehydrogenase complex dihydrolipoyllysine-residue succinyltransferase [Acidocella aminolytica]|jgi:2-oxoglutarate dehydrogenase E2 component (dihydrolipoamide succinyltransferase)|uniref:Dihydrolipoyllysine-residue succinyltransferase component of 2-oxoglutarate dehydrogenase complex n=1 Tax=Acidocella aminolytica 101 = DSM 11237 TaxID=1120923 RepID=A0A0D6PJA4_9PROT|nr:2-oxoglutarate dehydrogenase complex dihydrolipoyllysine-residue succinyltransferase [Acidocella aminolytica]GAN81268.1 dihydrolipoamide acetyltransferase/2-oxoglutarate dehydrogenase E2 component [Acidocella aminolytica 101 = DSM 11237]GBQ41112.1 2-oxoglutarate dehydrogenase E2 component [Acidocella aminolytica 101 = DSM 11237]SHE83923.1 2-oxoglutarate dehydrogenase E2 component [Acidocella aminolytica 101 = DSM 11237]